MTKLARLRKEAMSACNWRGHAMPYRWERLAGGVSWDYVDHKRCMTCRKWVTINCNPMPNDIEIGGPAVAVGCND